jgi:hypothetical protein
VLYVEDELKLLSEKDGVVPPNNIVVEANISNEGSEYNGSFTAVISDEDDWDETENITTNNVVIPSGSSGTTVTLTCAMENAKEGHTYTLSLFNPQEEEYLTPSYNSRVTFVAGKPVIVGIAQVATGKDIVFDGHQITCPAEEIDLYNVVGQRVATAKGTRLSTRGLPQGSYIARAKTAQGMVTKKICIRQH